MNQSINQFFFRYFSFDSHVISRRESKFMRHHLGRGRARDIEGKASRTKRYSPSRQKRRHFPKTAGNCRTTRAHALGDRVPSVTYPSRSWNRTERTSPRCGGRRSRESRVTPPICASGLRHVSRHVSRVFTSGPRGNVPVRAGPERRTARNLPRRLQVRSEVSRGENSPETERWRPLPASALSRTARAAFPLSSLSRRPVLPASGRRRTLTPTLPNSVVPLLEALIPRPNSVIRLLSMFRLWVK